MASGLLIIPLAFYYPIADAFFSPKWMVIYAISAAWLCYSLAANLKFQLPKRYFGMCLILLLAAHCFCTITNYPIAYQNSTLDLLTLLTVFLAGFNLATKRHAFFFANFIALVVVSALVLMQQFTGSSIVHLPMSPFPAATFGFQNMTAEFLGISSLLAVALPLPEKSKLQMFTLPVAVFGGILCVSLQSRSSWLALAAGCLVFGLQAIRTRQQTSFRISKFGFTIIALMLILAIGVIAKPSLLRYAPGNLSGLKALNTQIRLARWQNTLEMIKTRPISGFGPANFEFSYQPFSKSVVPDPEATEKMIVRSSHNGYLDAFADYGIIFGTLLVLALAYPLIILLKEKTSARSYVTSALVVGVFLATDALFAFPMQQAYPAYALALFIGLALSEVKSEGLALPSAMQMGVQLIFLSLITVCGLHFFSSKVAELNQSSLTSEVENACELFPDNWRVCVDASYRERVSGRSELAYSTLTSILGLNPNNFVALRERMNLEAGARHYENACRDWATYQNLFNAVPVPPAFVVNCER